MANGVMFQIEQGIPVPTFRNPDRPRGDCKCGGFPREGYKCCDKCLDRIRTCRRKRMDRGLCEYFGCVNAPEEGRTSCSLHLKRMLAHALVLRASRIKARVCIDCGARPQWWTQRCILCRSDHSEGLPGAARTALKQYRRLESIDKRRAKAEELLDLIDDERARRVFILRHGLADGIDHTLEEIGANLGITRERVRQIESQAFRILEYQGHDVSLIRAPFGSVQRPRRSSPQKPVLVGKEQRKKNRAHSLVKQAIKQGDLIKQRCQECGDVNSVAHHRDYDKPLEVEWLCRRHHMAAHGRGRGSSALPTMRAVKKTHVSTWLNKVAPTNQHYDAIKIVRILRAHKVKQIETCVATGLKRATLLDIVHGRPVADRALLIMLRFVERLQPSEKTSERPIDRFLDN